MNIRFSDFPHLLDFYIKEGEKIKVGDDDLPFLSLVLSLMPVGNPLLVIPFLMTVGLAFALGAALLDLVLIVLIHIGTKFIDTLGGWIAMFIFGFMLFWLIKSGTWRDLFDFVSSLFSAQ